jgi:glycosyltransferase involved in cell wall biosynthesis
MKERIELSGWFAVPGKFSREELKEKLEIKFFLNSKSNSERAANYPPLGQVELPQRGYIENFKVSTEARPIHGEQYEHLVAYDFTSTLNIAGIIPLTQNSAEAFELLGTLKLFDDSCQTLKTEFSVLSKDQWGKPFGGFLFPNTISIKSEELLIEGWALRSNDPLVEVKIFFRNVYVGQAKCGLKTMHNGQAFPDPKFADHAVFSLLLNRNDIKKNLLLRVLLQRGFSITAKCKFSSGAELEFGTQKICWLKGNKPMKLSTRSYFNKITHRNRKKHVLFVTPNLSEVEGAPKVLFNIVKKFIESSERENLEILLIAEEDGGLKKRYLELGIKVEIIADLSIFGKGWSDYHLKTEPAIKRVVEFAPDLIYCNVLFSVWAVEAGSRLNCPVIWLIHESTDPLIGNMEIGAELRLLTVQMLKYASRLIFVSEATKKLFVEYVDEKKCQVIKNGIDLEEINKVKNKSSKFDARNRLGLDDELVVSIVGTTTERKGQEVFVAAMAKLKNNLQGKKVKYFVVGAREGLYLETLKKEVRDLGLSEDLKFIPETPNTSDYYLASDVMAICSREESSPLVSLESFAYERPLVSTKVFGLAEQIVENKNGLCFKVDDASELAQKVMLLASNQELREQLVRGGSKTIKEKYDLNSSVAAHVEQIARLLQSVS